MAELFNYAFSFPEIMSLVLKTVWIASSSLALVTPCLWMHCLFWSYHCGSLALLAGSLTLLALWLSVSTFSILVQHLHLHRGGGYYFYIINIGVGLF